MLTLKSRDGGGGDFNLLMELLRGEHWQMLPVIGSQQPTLNKLTKKTTAISLRNCGMAWIKILATKLKLLLKAQTFPSFAWNVQSFFKNFEKTQAHA